MTRRAPTVRGRARPPRPRRTRLTAGGVGPSIAAQRHPAVPPSGRAGRCPRGNVMPLIPPALTGVVATAIDVLRHVPFGPRLITSTFVGLLANATEPRPRPLTLAGGLHHLGQPHRPLLHRAAPPAGAARPAAAVRGGGARALPAAPRPGGAVGRHQRDVPALRPVVHRQLPAHRPQRLAEEHLDAGDRLLPDLRALGGEDPHAPLDGGRPAQVAAARRAGVPAVPVRADGQRRARGEAGVQGSARRGVPARRPAGRRVRAAEGPVLRRRTGARQLHHRQHRARRPDAAGAQPDRRAAGAGVRAAAGSSPRGTAA